MRIVNLQLVFRDIRQNLVEVCIFFIIFFLLQYLYVELATKERPHHHADGQTQAFTHARNVKDMISEVKSWFLNLAPLC